MDNRYTQKASETADNIMEEYLGREAQTFPERRLKDMIQSELLAFAEKVKK